MSAIEKCIALAEFYEWAGPKKAALARAELAALRTRIAELEQMHDADRAMLRLKVECIAELEAQLRQYQREKAFRK